MPVQAHRLRTCRDGKHSARRGGGPTLGSAPTIQARPAATQVNGDVAVYQLVVALNCTHEAPYPHTDTAVFAANVTLAPEEEAVVRLGPAAAASQGRLAWERPRALLDLVAPADHRQCR